MDKSALQRARYKYTPKQPKLFTQSIQKLQLTKGSPTEPVSDKEKIKALFPHTYGLPTVSFSETSDTISYPAIHMGVILSGGQAPGGHNVISGLFDGLKKGNKESKLFGFLGGPDGILKNEVLELTDEIIDEYRNTGGFDIIGSGRTKLETEEQFEQAAKVCQSHGITSIVIIGGDDSNTNAAVLAEYFIEKEKGITVNGCPKTIDGDLKNEHIEISFGFDTATKTYNELIGNIMRDSLSAKKYWHFIKLMGRSASHIALECALATQPNICLISEEIAQNETSLDQIVKDIALVVAKRAEKGLNFGIVLIPEGVVEFIPEVKSLIAHLNTMLALNAKEYGVLDTWKAQYAFVVNHLQQKDKEVFVSLPTDIQRQLLMDRDPHGNVQVSRIETEKMLIQMVATRLEKMKAEGTFKGSFSGLNHFFGYEGRCSFPSNFDADYCYNLGYNAYLLAANKCSGYISAVSNLTDTSEHWQAGGIPITMMLNCEERHGEIKPVIKKALVDLKGAPFAYFEKHRDLWAVETSYLFPGSIQYFGPSEVSDTITKTLELEHK